MLTGTMAVLIRTEAFWSRRFSPLFLEGLECWYDAEDSPVVFDTEPPRILEWHDISGNNQHAIPPGLAQRPSRVANVFGARAGMDFSTDRAACGTVACTQAGTIFYAGMADSVHIGAIMGRGANNDSTAGVNLRFLGSGIIQGQIGNGTARRSASTAADTYTTGQVVRVIYRWDTTDLRLEVNGTEVTNLGHGLTGTYGTSGLVLGSLAPDAALSVLDGKYGTIGKGNVAISDARTAQLRAWLNSLYPS